MAGRLEGKTVIILGASAPDSMGAATSRKLADEGAQLVLAARREDDIATQAKNVGALCKAADITQEQDLAELADFAVSKYGSLDGAVNFAGAEFPGAIDELTQETLEQSAQVHLVGSTLFFKHMARRMPQGGSILTTSSLTALLAPPGLAAYAGAKAAVDHVVRIAAVEYGPKNIRVNAVAPGFTRTAMTQGYFAVPSVVDAFLKEIPLGRNTTVQDVANAASWLLSDESFVTGQVIDLTGGQSLRRTPTPAEMGF